MTNYVDTTVRRLLKQFGGASTAATPADVARLASLLDELDIGLVPVDPATDVANLNRTAASLLDLPAGDTTATAFARALRTLADRALNRTQAVATIATMERDGAAELNTTWVFSESPTHLGVVSKPAPFPGFGGRIWAFTDNSPLAQAVDASKQVNALVRASSNAMLDPQVLLEAVRDENGTVDLIYRDANTATCDYFGVSRAELLGNSIRKSSLMERYVRCAETGEPVIVDEFQYLDEAAGLRHYDVRAAQIRPGMIAVTWRDVTERFELTQRVADSEQRFRLLAENVADVVVRLRDDSTITWISNSVEHALGAPSEHWIGRRAVDLSAFYVPEDKPADIARWAEIAGGRTHIGRAKVYGADNSTHWIHLHSKPFYDAAGVRDGMVISFRVIDGEVAAEERSREQINQRDAQNRSLNERLRAQTDRLTSELNSAARYVASILPGNLSGPVQVSACYVPSRELGGDSYDYRWIDDDHLLVYLIDVSGHGVEPAMVSVSVHNLIRSGSIAVPTLLDPTAVLTELNRLFQMDRQGGHFFTMWYGVYQRSSRTLRYAGAGHPPALVLSAGMAVTELRSDAPPIGIQDQTSFPTHSRVLPPSAEVVIYSDGAFDLDLSGGAQWSLPQFVDLCTGAAQSADWTLEELLTELQGLSASGLFNDDCTLVRLTIA